MAQYTKKENRRAFNITRILIFVLVAVIIGCSVYNWNAKKLTGNQLPMPFGIGAAVVLSGSMEPELSVNDLIIVKGTDSFYIGQIVVYQDGNSLTVHRIIKIDGEDIVTQGDANNTADDPIRAEDIKGEMLLSVPYVGVIIEIVQQPIVIALILGASVWLLERSYRKEKDKDTDELTKIIEEIKKLKNSDKS